MTYDNYGYLRIKTYLASGATPLEGALVKIYGSDEYNSDVQYSLLTDLDGITSVLTLPTPPESYSLSPGSAFQPYSVYNVEISKDGFYPKKIYNVPIFAKTNSLLPIEMIPISYAENGITVPLENLNSVVFENENLR